ncbi:MAG: sulfate adenylyltransferase subunit CysN [Planctomycetota bacterium]|jgi:bifunctional enzyme CysN/CysC
MDQATEIAELGIEGYLEKYRMKGLLRLLTCGSVDDGKSTLIGRLLYDSQQVFDDHMAAVTKDSAKFGTTGEEVDLALLVDGLQAEREQGITIDVAYRYFSTSKRKFIIADTPGHEQYTRNMATGAANSELAIILIDARHGVLDQTRRHSFIVSLLGIRHVVVAINKMDLMDYSEEVFEKIRRDYLDFAAKLQIADLHFMPISALKGDNVVHQSENMPWHKGGPLLDYLETVHVSSDRNLIDLRFPVQSVMRPDLNFRGYSGTIASGILRKGDEVVSLPSGKRSKVAGIHRQGGDIDEAFASMAVTVTLEDEIDISRGDVLVHPGNAPRMGNSIEAMVVWMDETPLKIGGSYLIKHGTVQTAVTVDELRYRSNINSLHREESETLQLNEIGRLSLQSMRPLAYDPYAANHTMGSFILIDRLSNATVAAGMIVNRRQAEESLGRRRDAADAGSNLRQQRSTITPEDRARLMGQEPVTIWLTGLPRAGKTSIAFALEAALFERGKKVHVLDGEILRTGLSSDLGFSAEDRWEHHRRAGEVARLCNDQGLISIASLISPMEADREQVRRIVGEDRFVEVYCDAPVEVCEARDDQGLYERARAGEIQNVTGVDAPYEVPKSPALVLDTVNTSIEENVRLLLAKLGLG